MSLSVRLRHSFGAFSLAVDFEAAPGVTVLFGPSGSGKSTVMNAVAGLLQPNAGRISLAGRVLLDTEAGICATPHRRRLGVIFQEGRLFPHLSVAGNLRYAGRFLRRPPAPGQFDQIVAMLGIDGLLDRRPAQLSGGEKQRVAIGRALLAQPDLILADEPLSALDDARKAEILPYFERLRDETAVPILYVSHAASEVARLATQVVVLRDGQVERDGPAREVLSDPAILPAGVRAAGALLTARIAVQHEDGLTELDAGGQRLFVPRVPQPAGTELRMRILAQDVILAHGPPQGLSALNILPGRVTQIRPGSGPGVIVSLDTRAGPLLARITRRSSEALGLKVGRELHAVVKTIAIAPEDIGTPRAPDPLAGAAAPGRAQSR